MSRKPPAVFDTNVYIEFPALIATAKKSALSAVVFYELTATNISDGELKFYELTFDAAKAEKRLLTPSDFDWREAAKMVRRLRQLSLTAKATTATVLQNDALIARTAWIHEYAVVTGDIDDFELLKKVLPKKSTRLELQLFTPQQYFDL